MWTRQSKTIFAGGKEFALPRLFFRRAGIWYPPRRKGAGGMRGGFFFGFYSNPAACRGDLRRGVVRGDEIPPKEVVEVIPDGYTAEVWTISPQPTLGIPSSITSSGSSNIERTFSNPQIVSKHCVTSSKRSESGSGSSSTPLEPMGIMSTVFSAPLLGTALQSS